MVNGMIALRKRTPREWDKMENVLTSLEFREGIKLTYVEDDQEVVTCLYNHAGNLGIREEKLISRTYLPFCSDINVQKGNGDSDTYKQMLQQIVRLTDATGIIADHLTMGELRIAYNSAPHPDTMLAECKMGNELRQMAAMTKLDGPFQGGFILSSVAKII
ncbi:hypothetical protein D9757_002785 [Collybiopsis confluens]|uniref:Uncharacterized protein n=1 Tax=Collybiopsis confluens TaxID=2823264 RepID=A0A8H5HVM5_9AGAR|nr:hypothetical protein D9757_002785 [Collybiopsis confluens]